MNYPTPFHLVLHTALALALTVPISRCLADEGDSASESFDRILTEQTRKTFDRIGEYVRQNPDAEDAEEAWKWLFNAALDHDLEAKTVDLARDYLKKASESPETRALAQQALSLGLASTGQSEEAVQPYSDLRIARFQSGGVMIKFGRRLATELQMARDFDAARKVYEAISRRFFLNTDVRALCETRLARIDLVGKPAPAINAVDIDGEEISLSRFEGKVVLLDFWATNCPPCLEEMPNIKAIYSDWHDKGFEVIGVSLDFDASIVEQFAKRNDISWPMIVDEATVEGLRERYHVPKIPALFVIDQSGNVYQSDVRGQDLRKTVESLLGKFPAG